MPKGTFLQDQMITIMAKPSSKHFKVAEALTVCGALVLHDSRAEEQDNEDLMEDYFNQHLDSTERRAFSTVQY